MPNNSSENSSGMMMMVMMLMVGCAFMVSSGIAGYFVMTNPDLLSFSTAPALPANIVTETSAPSTTTKPSKKKPTSKSGGIPSKASAYIQAEECAVAGKKNHVLAAGTRGAGTGDNNVSVWCAEPVKFYFDGPYAAGSEKFYYLRLTSNKNRALKWYPGNNSPFLDTYTKSDPNQQWIIGKNDDGKTYNIKNRGIAKAGSSWVYLGVSNDCDNIGDKRHMLFYHSSPHKFTFHKATSTMSLSPNDECPK